MELAIDVAEARIGASRGAETLRREIAGAATTHVPRQSTVTSRLPAARGAEWSPHASGLRRSTAPLPYLASSSLSRVNTKVRASLRPVSGSRIGNVVAAIAARYWSIFGMD